MNNRQRSTPIHSGFSSGFSNPDYMNMDFQHEMNRRNEFSYLGYEAEAENKIDLFKIFQQQAHQSFFENPEPFERNTFGDSRQEISIHQRNQSLVSDSSTSRHGLFQYEEMFLLYYKKYFKSFHYPFQPAI